MCLPFAMCASSEPMACALGARTAPGPQLSSLRSRELLQGCSHRARHSPTQLCARTKWPHTSRFYLGRRRRLRLAAHLVMHSGLRAHPPHDAIKT